MRSLTRTVKSGVALVFSVAMVVGFADRASAAPTSEFTYDVMVPAVAEPVTFTFAGTCDVAPCRIQWTLFTTGGSHLGTAMGEGLVLTYAFPAAGTYSIVASITNATSTHGSASMTHTLTVVPATGGSAPPVPTPPVVTAPSAPGAPHATAVKSGGVTTVRWTAPEPIVGAPVIRYVVSVDGRRTVVKDAATSLTVKGLRAGPAKILVRAVNVYGISRAAVTEISVPRSVARAPKPALHLGMSGAAVTRLQTALKMRRHTGQFGRATRAAVLGFQRAHGLNRTGVANDRMRYLLAV
jgi:peptidoglycan hydrolase-like protein with peptidoglycan-binding domain